MKPIQPVILSGGSGTRLWPRSLPERPKPFLPLLGERTLFQRALDRVSDRQVFSEPLIVAGQSHVAAIEEQASAHRLIVEPAARSTAPAIALAAKSVDPDTVLLVCPSDHFIGDVAAFHQGVIAGSRLAQDGWLVAFGVRPDRPETGFGYIERGEELEVGHRIARFVEKPDIETARAFLEQGGLVWNAGIFVFRAGSLLDELAIHRPEIARLIDESVSGGSGDDTRFHPAAGPFEDIAGESIDYAVMESTTRAAVVSADMNWSDIGDWSSLMEARAKDESGNVLIGPARCTDASRVMVDTDGPRVSVVGIDDVIVVVDGNEVLVVSKDAAQAVGRLPQK
ncbi:MAG: mannose-1-phosphate guanylyltransferase [Citromicrobium sp.]|nr:MAG: mannose-1-phosphate guanylyltransferase [Citromicrobium sp.]